jgi:hypothetical protein
MALDATAKLSLPKYYPGGGLLRGAEGRHPGEVSGDQEFVPGGADLLFPGNRRKVAGIHGGNASNRSGHLETDFFTDCFYSF